jgi:GHKL domain
MAGWTAWIGAAAATAFSYFSAYIFLRLRFRGIGSPFRPRRTTQAAMRVIIDTATASAFLGLFLAFATSNIALVCVSLLVPSVLWLPNAAEERIRRRGNILPESLAWIKSPIRRLDERMGRDMEEWCEVRLNAAAKNPQWVSDAATYYYGQIEGRLKDGRAKAELSTLVESITHRISIVLLISLNTTPARIRVSLKKHPSTSGISKYEIDDLARLEQRLLAEARDELHLFLAYVYRLGYRSLLIYPFKPHSRRDARASARTPIAKRSPVLREGPAYAGIARHGERLIDASELHGQAPSDTVGNHSSTEPPTILVPDEHVRSSYLIVSEMAHSMKTPLAHLESVIELLCRSLVLPDRETADALHEMGTSVNMCRVTLTAYREVTRVADQIEQRVTESLGEVLEAMHKIYARQSGKRTKLEVRVPNQVAGYSNNYILAILFPLLENAVEASPATANISITSSQAPGHIEFAIKNYIERPVYLDRIGSRGQTSKPGHEGLGITVVKHLVSEHRDASTSCESHNNQFIFRISLPRREL